MDQYKVDFHIHTTYSDGQSSPTAIVKRAKELDYDIIAITDHDGVDGIKEALIAGEAVELEVVPGIEFSAETADGISVHILGYHIDADDMELKKAIETLRRMREDRNGRLIELLCRKGYDISKEDLRCRQPNGYIGKPVIARVLAAKGYIKSPDEAFQTGGFFESDEAKAIKREKLSTKEIIRVIKGAGGIAVLAHPIQTKGVGEKDTDVFFENIGNIVGKLKKEGLGGIECYHPDQNHEQSMRFVAIAEKYHLHITRGSDFHGKDFADAQATAE